MNELNIGDYILDQSNYFRIGKVINIDKEKGCVSYKEYWDYRGKLENNIHRCSNLKDVVKFNSITIKLVRDSIKIIDMFLEKMSNEEI